MMSQPLAERLRPKTLDDYIGQKHLVGQGAVLRKMIDAGRVPSFILWGPPGVGKTTLAQIIANKLDAPFYTLSAISSGVKDVREVIEKAKRGEAPYDLIEVMTCPGGCSNGAGVYCHGGTAKARRDKYVAASKGRTPPAENHGN